MNEPNDSFWWRLVYLNPALYRGFVMAFVLLAASAGIMISPELPNSLIGFVAAFLAIVQALWTKPSVTANARVAVMVPDPINNSHIVIPGEAVTSATDAEIIAAAQASGVSNEESNA